MSAWSDALNNAWLPQEQIEKIEDPADQYLIGQFRLAYLNGKGKKFVPVLMPEDLIAPLQVLVKYRAKHGIKEDRTFFATKSKTAMHHCSGWHAVNGVCKASGITINATDIGYPQPMPAFFLDHMGH